MQRSSNLSRILLSCVVILVVAFATQGFASGLFLEMEGSPTPLHRGDTLSLSLIVRNTSPDVSGELTLFVPLPTGLNQWTAHIEIDGGSALAYPPNGLVAIGSLSSNGIREILITADVESTAPADLWLDADLLGPTGRVADGSLRINVGPSVDAGPDRIVELGGRVSLTGASADDGGSPIPDLIWSDGGAGGVFDDDRALHPIYTAPSISGLIELTLIATDEDGASTSDSMRLSVNSLPTVDAGDDLEATEGASVLLDSSTAGDPDGSIVGRTWSDGGAGGTFLPSPDALHPTYVIPILGGCEAGVPLILSLTVTDDRGAEATDSITVWVENLIHAPTVVTGPDREIVGGQTVVLSGEAGDEDGDIDAVSWAQVDGPPVDLIAGSSTETWFNAPEVSIQTLMRFELVAIDSCGLTASDSISIVLLPDSVPSDPPSDPTPDDPQEPADGVSSLSIGLEIMDERGLPIHDLSELSHGDRVVLAIAVTNTGETVLERLSAAIRGQGPAVLETLALAPWQTARAEVVVVIDAEDSETVWIVDALAVAPSGRMVRATDRLLWRSTPADAELRLLLETDPADVAVGGAFSVAYRIVYSGSGQLDDLVLIDDRLGRIDLPLDRIEAGGTIDATAPDGACMADLPGPISRTATVSGFTAGGRRLVAEASLDTPVDTDIAGGGGSGEGNVGVVISEVAWAGNPDDRSAEWIELANVGSRAIDLEGWAVCWIAAERASAPIEEWTSVRLTGTIEPIPADSMVGRPAVFEAAGDGVWRVLDGDPGDGLTAAAAPGYYLLERGSDLAIANIPADCVYGGPGEEWELPDRGAVIVLLDSQGRIADSANAAAGPWPAGLRRTGATMERIDLLNPDSPEAWRTNPGLLAYGRSTRGTRLWASAGHASSPDLEELIETAKGSVPALSLTETTRLPVSLPASAATPWLHLAVLPETGSSAAGGGGAASPMPRLSTERQGDEVAVTLDPDQLPAGLCFVWIIGEEGEARLILVRAGP